MSVSGKDIIDTATSAAIATAQRFGGSSDDYLGEAYLAAASAARRFDPRRGVKFRSFALLNVTKHLSDWIFADRGYRRTTVDCQRTRVTKPHRKAGPLHETVAAPRKGTPGDDAADVVHRLRFRVRSWEYSRMRAAGMLQRQIAKALGLSTNMVGYDLRNMREAVRA